MALFTKRSAVFYEWGHIVEYLFKGIMFIKSKLQKDRSLFIAEINSNGGIKSHRYILAKCP
ncbi:hypothetical protein, partial [Chengkuizengella axinellae]